MADDSAPDESVNMDNDISTNKISDMEDFNARMHNLPVELFDTTRDLALSEKLEAPTDTQIRIDRNYQPPIALQINSATRKSFACTYYTRNTFAYAEASTGLFVKFLKSLGPFHRRYIRKIFMLGVDGPVSPLNTDRVARAMLEKLKSAYGSGKEMMFESDAVLSTSLWFKRGDGSMPLRRQSCDFQGTLVFD